MAAEASTRTRQSSCFFLFLYMLLRVCLLLVMTLGCTLYASAQLPKETNVHIRILNTAREPVSFATIIILNVPDTIHKQQQITDSNGVALFKLIPMRPYIFRISAINY